MFLIPELFQVFLGIFHSTFIPGERPPLTLILCTSYQALWSGSDSRAWPEVWEMPVFVFILYFPLAFPNFFDYPLPKNLHPVEVLKARQLGMSNMLTAELKEPLLEKIRHQTFKNCHSQACKGWKGHTQKPIAVQTMQSVLTGVPRGLNHARSQGKVFTRAVFIARMAFNHQCCSIFSKVH